MKKTKETLSLLENLLVERDKINNKIGFNPDFGNPDEYLYIITFPTEDTIGKGVDNNNKHLFYFQNPKDLTFFHDKFKKELIFLSKNLFAPDMEISKENSKELYKHNIKEGDILEVKKYRSAKTGVVFKETRAMFVDFGDEVISLDLWNENLRFTNNSDYDVIAHKRLTPEEAKYCTPQNHYCAKNVQDRYEEVGLKQDIIKRSLR